MQDEPLLAAAALAAGLLIEHGLLIYMLYREIAARDISLPRLRRPRMPLRMRIVIFLGTRFGGFWRALQRMARSRGVSPAPGSTASSRRSRHAPTR